ncbi:MAG: DUF4878 domain-containing protein [Candidatus Terrybacteria bacterium]|nr:DUF4878 domain-containing protein [Candidatus Terrybacteria bacterium]
MKFFNEIKIKRGLKFGVIIFAAFVAVVLILSNLYTFLEKKKQEKIIKELQRPYLEDTYGGKTPEETLELFIQALKEGNIDLASKYFVIEKQEEQKEYLQKVANIGRIEEMINDLNGKLDYKGSLYENNKQFKISDNNGNVIFGLIDFVKYPREIWKIIEI